MLGSVDSQLVTDVSGLSMVLIFKGQAGPLKMVQKCCPETTIISRVTYQKSEDLIYIAVEHRKHDSAVVQLLV
jgi:hypothetical protein